MAAITSAVVVAGTAVYGATQSAKAGKQQGKALQQQKEAADRQADIADRQQEMSEEQWNRYKTVYQPIEDEYVNEAKGLGSIANQEKSATEARADVAGAYSRARDQLTKTPGSNPTSQTYQQEANRINLAEAATSAASQTSARRATVDKGRSAMSDVINLGKGLPSSAAAGLAGSAATNGSVASNASSLAGAYGNQANGVNNAIGGFSRAVGGLMNNPTVQGWGTTLGNWATGGVSTSQVMGGGFGTGNSYGNQDIGQFI